MSNEFVLPYSEITEAPPGPAFGPAGEQEIPVFVGPCSSGPINSPRQFNGGDLLGPSAMFGTGPVVKEAALFAARLSMPFNILRTNPTTIAASIGPVVVVLNGSSTITHTVSGTPTDGADVVILFGVVGGETGTGPIGYQVSLQGAEGTYGAAVPLGTGTTITVLGVTVNLGTAHIVTEGDTISFSTYPASSALLPITYQRAASSTGMVAAAGTPADAYEVGVQVVGEATAGTSLSITYTLDYGSGDDAVWSQVINLSTATTYELLDGPVSQVPTGITLTFAGSFDNLDVILFNTTSPAYDSAGITAALNGPNPQTNPQTGLLASSISWTWIRFVGPVSEVLASTLDSIVSGWDSKGIPSWGICDARDRRTYESLSTWSTDVGAEWASTYTSTHVAPAAGMARLPCPINGRHNRRSSAINGYVVRLAGWSIQVDPAQFDRGPLAGVSIDDDNGVEVEHNANTDPSLQALGFLTLRTWPGYTGVYPTRGSFVSPANDLTLIPTRRVLNLGKKLQAQVQQLQVCKSFRVVKVGQTGTGLVPGNLYPVDQAKINRLGTALIGAALVSPGYCSGFTFTVNPTPIQLVGEQYKLAFNFQVRPLIYVYGADGIAQLVSPTLTV
jgi:hypothetical protein